MVMSSQSIISEEDFASVCSKLTDVFFVQIGANDGVSFDPIHDLVLRYNWSGILVEPGAEAFDALKHNYSGRSNLMFLNYAISDRDGFVELYCGTTTPHFTLDFIKAKHMFDVEPKAVRVPCMSMKTLMNRYVKNNKIDILQIDAEGHDHIILNDMDFEQYLPKIVRFEYVSIGDKFLNNCLTKLLHFGYTIHYSSDGADVIAIREIK